MSLDSIHFQDALIHASTYHLGGELKEERDLETSRFCSGFCPSRQNCTATPSGEEETLVKTTEFKLALKDNLFIYFDFHVSYITTLHI